MKRCATLAIALFGASGGSLPAEAGEGDLRVCVLVVDASGLAPLPDSTVVLRPVRKDEAAGRDAVWVPSGEPSISLETDGEGVACAEGLPAGNYLPEISRPGFWSTRSEPFQFPPEPCKTPLDAVERLDIRVGLAARRAPDADRSGEKGEATSATSTPRGPTRRLRITILEETTAPIPGVTVMLLPVSGADAESDEAWLPCRWSTADGCGAITGVTGGRGGVCLDDLPAGRYRVRAQLDGFWETEVGPIEVPSSAFEQVKLPLALELTWAMREELKHIVVTSEDGWPELAALAPAPPPDDCP